MEIWFRKLVQDKHRSDLAEATSIDVNVLGRIVANFRVFVAKPRTEVKEHQEQKLLDIGVLRYPLAQDARFQVGLISSLL